VETTPTITALCKKAAKIWNEDVNVSSNLFMIDSLEETEFILYHTDRKAQQLPQPDMASSRLS
jgi:hypothetical protein